MENNLKTYERYSRQIILKEFGLAAQKKLLNSKVLVIGAGGLACAALQYLAAAGIGTIGIVDDDIVSLNNLHRQILYSTQDIGALKVIKAKNKLLELNPEINIIDYCERLTTQNALDIISNFDIVIDGTDNFASRYMINDACVLLDKPMIYGAVSQFEGQVAIFNYHSGSQKNAVNYRDLFPEPPKDNELLNCEEAGVLGILPGIIGIMQANETIKLITGIGKLLSNILLTYNALSNKMYEVALIHKENSLQFIPQNEEAFKSMNYTLLCTSKKNNFEIDAALFKTLLSNNFIEVIDIRAIGELPIVGEFAHIQIPFSQILEQKLDSKSDTIILFCQTGKRSLMAAQQLSAILGAEKKVYSLQGGIVNWLKYNSQLV